MFMAPLPFTADVSLNCRTQAQKFEFCEWPLSHNCTFIDFKQSASAIFNSVTIDTMWSE